MLTRCVLACGVAQHAHGVAQEFVMWNDDAVSRIKYNRLGPAGHLIRLHNQPRLLMMQRGFAISPVIHGSLQAYDERRIMIWTQHEQYVHYIVEMLNRLILSGMGLRYHIFLLDPPV